MRGSISTGHLREPPHEVQVEQRPSASTALSWLGVLVMASLFVSLLGRLAATAVKSRPPSRVAVLATVQTLTTAAPTDHWVGNRSSRPPILLPPTCAVCHAVVGSAGRGGMGPDLTHIGTVAGQRIRATDYTGSATTASEYIRESLLDPDAYIVPGSGYSTASGTSTMPSAANLGLGDLELDQLVADLARLQ